MARLNRRVVTVVLVMVGIALSGNERVRGQDPDGGAGRGRPLAAYRPGVPGVHGLVTAGHPLAAIAGLQVLLITGETAPQRQQQMRDSGLQVLLKPVAADRLLHALASMAQLDKAPAGMHS